MGNYFKERLEFYFIVIVWFGMFLWFATDLNESNKQIMNSFGIYAQTTFVISILALLISDFKFMRYLKAHHNEKWVELTSVPFVAPNGGGLNSIKTLKFTYSDDDLGDVKVKEMKKASRTLIPLPFVILFTHVLVAGTLIWFKA